MSTDTYYHVFFTNTDGDREYLPNDFSSETEAKEAVKDLKADGCKKPGYEPFDFELDDYP